MTHGFLNVAHRGARAFAPENTLPAVRMAARLGANAVELDVQMSRDGELVVFHDDDLRRCSDAASTWRERSEYPVGAFTWRELSSLDVGSWYWRELRRPAHERQPFLRTLSADEADRWIAPGDLEVYGSGSIRIPRLHDALRAARAHGLAVILDVKTIPRRSPQLGSRVVDAVQEERMEREVLISSFDHALLADVRRLHPTIPTGVLTAERLVRAREYVRGLDADAFEPGCSGETDILGDDLSLDSAAAAEIRELTSAGLLVIPWTENREPRMRALVQLGVAGIITDFPNRLAHVLGEMQVSSGRPRLRRIEVPPHR